MKYLLEQDIHSQTVLRKETNQLLDIMSKYFFEKWKLKDEPKYDFLVQFLVKKYLSERKIEISIKREEV